MTEDYENKYLVLFKDKKTGIFKLKREFTGYTVEKYSGELTDFYEILKYFKSKYKDCCIDSKIDDMRGHLMTIDNWKESCEEGFFIDYDGYGDVLDENYEFLVTLSPSKRKSTPNNAKYIMWYNR